MQHTAHEYTPLETAGFAHPGRNVGLFNIEPGMHVADFGAGSGAYALEMAQALGNTGVVYAIDVQRDLLRRLHNEATKRELTNLRIIWADLEKPTASKVKSGTLDLVLVSNILFQIEDKRALFIEAKRILKPSGTLVLIDWSDSFSGMGPHKKDVFTKSAALQLAQENGFTEERAFHAGAHHWGLMLLPASH